MMRNRPILNKSTTYTGKVTKERKLYRINAVHQVVKAEVILIKTITREQRSVCPPHYLENVNVLLPICEEIFLFQPDNPL